ncbi:hypothetical protein [Mycetocola saprophilus]|uniref:hypothetical protein n=1 Tax=Mycetocola saprophilus TaxID=76636 RepID=UPI0004C2254D|nr:hypothetical protein [Mycetocola saprophilus]
MDLTITKESYGGSKLSWLGSRRGVDTARTVTIDRTKLTPAQVTAGVLPAGTPLAASANKVAPYTAAEGQVFVGFLLTDQAIKPGGGDIVAPLLDHGRIRVAKLPVAFTAPDNATSFVFV